MNYFELLEICILEQQSFQTKNFAKKNSQVVRFNFNIFRN